MKIKKAHYLITAVCIISGILIGWQVQLYDKATSEQNTNPKSELVDTIKNLEEETSQLEKNISSLRSEIANLQGEQVHGKDRLGNLQEELQWQRAIAGLTSVTGPGILITLDDNAEGAQEAEKNEENYDPEKYIIHDKDILYLINELKLAGAEAISVNEQRIVSSSDIRCVGTVILVNSTRLAPPYTIKAIGNPRVLENKIANGEEYPYLQYKGFPVELETQETVEISAYTGSFGLDNARLWEPKENDSNEGENKLNETQ